MNERNREFWTEVQKSPVLGCLVGLPLLLIAAVLSIPFAIIFRWVQGYQEGRLRKRLARAGRTLPWIEVARHLAAGEGTLIIQRAQKDGERVWWTPEDVVSLAPVQRPDFDDFAFVCPDAANPFAAWSLDRYLSVTTGLAFLTSTPLRCRLGHFTGSVVYQEAFPAARIVVLPSALWNTRR